MRLRKRSQGIALIICLLVLAMVLVFAQAMGTLGMHHLGVVNADYHEQISVWAAEAGAARALHELAANSSWATGFTNVALTDSTRSAYTVRVTPNSSGAGTVQAPDGTQVPPGQVYVLSTGTCLDGKFPRSTAIMLSTGKLVPYVMASGGNMTLGGSADITGSVRAGGDLNFGGAVKVSSDSSGGRVLAGGVINVGSNITLESAQDIRARKQINSVSAVKGTTSIFPLDTTSDTDPFTTTGPLPSPDESALLAGAVVHSGSTTYGNKQTLDLAGKVQYFPDGVSFTNGSNITGTGTIVVGNGHAVTFGIPLKDLNMNVVALDSGDGTVGDAKIDFAGSTSLNGIVFSEGSVQNEAALTVNGAIIAYGTKSSLQLTAKASTKVVRAAPVAPLPGFQAYTGGGGGSGSLTIKSWQRL